MWTFLSVLAVCCTVVVLGLRAEPFIRRGMDIRERELFGEEESTPVEDEVPEDPMPGDLLGLVMNESESWARESMHRLIMERFEQTKDWDKVRAALAIQLQSNNDLT